MKYQSFPKIKIQSINNSKREKKNFQYSNQKSSQIQSLQDIQTFIQQRAMLSKQQIKYKFHRKIFNETSRAQDQQISQPIDISTSNILNCSELLKQNQQEHIPKAQHMVDQVICGQSTNISHQQRKLQKQSKIYFDSQQVPKQQNKINSQQWQELLDKLSNIQLFDINRDQIMNLPAQERLERLVQHYGEEITIPFFSLYQKYLSYHEKRMQEEKQKLKKFYEEKIRQEQMKRFLQDDQYQDQEQMFNDQEQMSHGQEQMSYDQDQMSGDQGQVPRDEQQMYEDNYQDSGDY